MSKNLIAYFSRKGFNYSKGQIVFLETGNTEAVAKKLQALSGADLFQIEPLSPYSEDYRECVQESKEELAAGARPSLKSIPDSIENYDTVYLGYPNWCGTCPMPVLSFLNSFDFTGKKLAPFCTNEGSGLGRSLEDIRKEAPAARLLPGLSIRGSEAADCENELKEWLKKLEGENA